MNRLQQQRYLYVSMQSPYSCGGCLSRPVNWRAVNKLVLLCHCTQDEDDEADLEFLSKIPRGIRSGECSAPYRALYVVHMPHKTSHNVHLPACFEHLQHDPEVFPQR